MQNEELEKRFQEAFEIASKMSQTSLPQDVQLRLYAYYKQATFGSVNFNQIENHDLRSAFKINAWIQISHLSADDSKKKYIELVELLLKN